MKVIPIDPLILRVWVPLPFDQVLYLVPSSELARLEDFLNFIFFFPIDKVRWGFCEIGSMELSLTIRGQEVYMENVVNLPLWGEFQLIGDRTFLILKGPCLFWASLVDG